MKGEAMKDLEGFCWYFGGWLLGFLSGWVVFSS